MALLAGVYSSSVFVGQRAELGCRRAGVGRDEVVPAQMTMSRRHAREG